MTPMSLFRTFFFLLFSVQFIWASPEKPNFQDDIVPVFEQSCNSCHNPDRSRGGLDLTSMNGIISGGSSGDVALPGDPDASLLYLLPARLQEPHMPPRGDKIEDSHLLLIKNWIAQGMLPTASGKPMQKKKPSFDLALGSVSLGKPIGPPPMPKHLDLQPTIVTNRAFAPSAMASAPWSPLVALAGQKQVLLYHTEKLSILGILPYEEGFIESLKFSRNGKLIIASGGRGGKSGNVIGWEVESGRRVLDVGSEQDTILTADISADQSLIAIGGTNKLIKVFDLATNEVLYQIKKHSEWVTQVSFSPDGILLATADRNGGLFVWEAKTGNPFYSLDGHKEEITGLSWRADGNVLLSGSEEGSVRTWEMINGKQVKTWNAHDGGVLSAHYAINGNIVTSGRDKKVKFWDGDGKALQTISGFSDIVVESRLSHDGSKIIAGDWSGRLSVWNANDGKELGSLSLNPPLIQDRILSAQDELLASQSILEKKQKKVQPLQQKIDQLSGLLSEENKNLQELNLELSTQGKQLEKLTQQISSVKKQDEQFSTSIKQLQSSTHSKSNEIALLKTKVSKVANEKLSLEKKEKELVQSISQIGIQLEKADAKENNSTDETTRLKQTLSAAKNELEKVRKLAGQKKEELISVQTHINTLNSQMDENSSRLEDLQEKQNKNQLTLKEITARRDSLENTITKQKQNIQTISLKAEKYQKEKTTLVDQIKGPQMELNEAKEKVSLNSKAKQKWVSEIINSERHQQIEALIVLKEELRSLQDDIEDDKNSLITAQTELDYANQVLMELPNKINEAREEVHLKQTDLKNCQATVDQHKHYLTKIEALIAKADPLVNEIVKNSEHTEPDSLLDGTILHFESGIKSLEKELSRVQEKIDQGNKLAVIAANQSKQAELNLEDVISLKNKAPAIAKDKKSVVETILTDIRNKESELQKIQKSVSEQQKKTEDLFNQYLNTLTSEIVNLN